MNRSAILMGASGVGKTTLAKKLSDKHNLRNLPSVSSGLRRELGGHQAILDDPHKRHVYQMKLAAGVASQLCEAIQSGVPFISERGLCCLAYHAVYGDGVANAIALPAMQQLFYRLSDPNIPVDCFVLEPRWDFIDQAAKEGTRDFYCDPKQVCYQHGALLGILQAMGVRYSLWEWK